MASSEWLVFRKEVCDAFIGFGGGVGCGFFDSQRFAGSGGIGGDCGELFAYGGDQGFDQGDEEGVEEGVEA